MAGKKWKDMNVGKRVRTLSNIQKKVQENIKKQEKTEEEKRRTLLGLGEKEEIKELEYKFSVSAIEKNEAEKILEKIGEKRYQNKDAKYQIFSFDTWTNWYKELRWPSHYASWIESIKVYNDGQIGIKFLTSNKTKSLEKEAQQIFGDIKKLL